VPSLKWSQAVLRDATRLHAFLKSKNPDAARRAIQTIRQGVRILASHPEIGRLIDDLPAEFREWVIEFGHGAYVVLYHFDGEEIVLLAIRHGRESGY
jgi:plasmid stabilization system protein ParE